VARISHRRASGFAPARAAGRPGTRPAGPMLAPSSLIALTYLELSYVAVSARLTATAWSPRAAELVLPNSWPAIQPPGMSFGSASIVWGRSRPGRRPAAAITPIATAPFAAASGFAYCARS